MTWNLDDLRAEYRIGADPCDPWGSAMAALFPLAAELWNRPDGTIPDAWRYSPGAMSGDPREVDDPWFEVYAGASTADLLAFGERLHRLCCLARARGLDY